LLTLSVAESFGSHPVCSICTVTELVDVGIPLELFCRDQTVISGKISGPAYFVISTMEHAGLWFPSQCALEHLVTGLLLLLHVELEGKGAGLLFLYTAAGSVAVSSVLLSSFGSTCVLLSLDEPLVKVAPEGRLICLSV
jgi:hypothetical protein